MWVMMPYIVRQLYSLPCKYHVRCTRIVRGRDVTGKNKNKGVLGAQPLIKNPPPQAKRVGTVKFSEN